MQTMLSKKENGETKIYKKIQGETRKKEIRKNYIELLKRLLSFLKII
jgi:hypothetical protein